jgi:hypothetical protein
MNFSLRRCLVTLTLTTTLGCGRREPVAPPAAPPAAPAAKPTPPLSPEDAAEQARLKKVATVLRCFHQDVRDKATGPEFAGYMRTLSEDIFVVDWLFAQPTRMDLPEDALCTELGEQFRTLFSAAQAKRKPVKPAAGQPAAPVVADAGPEFTRASNSPTLKHLLDHAEITQAALLEASGGKPRRVFEVIVFAGRAVALQRWGDLRYHAHSEEHQPAQQGAVASAGEQQFVSEIASSLATFVEEVRTGYLSNASLRLGAILHGAQDLALHQGVTRAQQAALELQADDGTRESARHQAHQTAIREAKRLTRDVLNIARKAMGENNWTKLVSWDPPGVYDPAMATKQFYRNEGQVDNLNALNLIRYWTAGRTPAAVAAAKQPQSLPRWDVARVFARLPGEMVSRGGAAFRNR